MSAEWSAEICKLPAGTVIKAVGAGWFETEHPVDGWQRFEIVPDMSPQGFKVVHTISGAHGTLSVGHSRS